MNASGKPDTALILRSGADTEMMSGLSRETTRIIADTEGIARSTEGALGLSAIAAGSRSFVVTLADGACANQGQGEGHLFIFREFDQWRGRVRTVEQLVKEFHAGPKTTSLP